MNCQKECAIKSLLMNKKVFNGHTVVKKLYVFKFLIVMLFVLLGVNVKSQPAYDMPRIISPSPQSQALTRYGDYPMADYAGLTDITIPLHTITSRKLSMPITMSFHASGRMANETNGILGMRWTLNCGGVITRTMKGLPDEWNSLSPYSYDFNNHPDPSFDFLYSACPNGKTSSMSSPNPTKYDTEYDIFNYSLPNGKSGHFILKNQNGTKVPMLIPYDGLKIELTKSQTDNGYFQNIAVTDIDGVKYIFGNTNGSAGNGVEDYFEFDLLEGKLGIIPTSWYLTKVISNDGSDEISLSYTTRACDFSNASESATVYDRNRNDDSQFYVVAGSTDPYQAYLRDLLVTYHLEQTGVVAGFGGNLSVPTLSEIRFQGGYISFSYNTVPVNNNNNLLLNEIVFNREVTPYKKLKFNFFKHASESDIYYLNDLQFYGESPNISNDKYGFTYYNPFNQVPAFYSSCEYKDWWGYYTLAANSLLAKRTAEIVPIPYGPGSAIVYRDIGSDLTFRDPVEDYKKTGMLKSITYPTGGQTEFMYEGNRYDYYPYYQPGQNPATLEGPGLRIKEVISKPVTGKNIHKIYKYGLFEDGRGFIEELLRPGSDSRSELMVAEGNAMHFWQAVTYTGDPPSPVYGSDNQTGYRIRNYFSDPYTRFDLGGDYIKYDAVTEYYVEDNVAHQKTQSRYSWGNNGQLNTFNVADQTENIHHQRKFLDMQNAWLTPVLTEKKTYKYANGQFNIIKNESYNYSAGIKDEAWDILTYLHTSIIYTRRNGNNEIDEWGQYNVSKQYHDYSCSVYGYGLRKYATGKQVLLGGTTEMYTSSGIIKTETYNEYDPVYEIIKSEKMINSKHDTSITNYTYPFDYPNTPVYQQMVQKNMLSQVVEQKSNLNSVLIKNAITHYYNPFNNVYVPQSIEVKNGGNAQEAVASFNKYDKCGNILEQQRVNDLKEVYLWGYHSRYPVAKIIGQKSYTDIIAQSGIDTSLLRAPVDDTWMRNYLKNKLDMVEGIQFTTYTYKPLVGMTSEMGPAGRITYYEYDVFGRLKRVKDANGKVISDICYNYAGQQVDCN